MIEVLEVSEALVGPAARAIVSFALKTVLARVGALERGHHLGVGKHVNAVGLEAIGVREDGETEALLPIFERICHILKFNLHLAVEVRGFG